jgi:hypothetical protein
MRILAALPGKNSRFALKQLSRQSLRCGGMVTPENSSNYSLRIALTKSLFDVME